MCVSLNVTEDYIRFCLACLSLYDGSYFSLSVKYDSYCIRFILECLSLLLAFCLYNCWTRLYWPVWSVYHCECDWLFVSVITGQDSIGHFGVFITVSVTGSLSLYSWLFILYKCCIIPN